MVKSIHLSRKHWMRRFVLGGLGVLGVFPTSANNAAESPAPSSGLQAWISDAKRKEARNGYSVAGLRGQTGNLLRFAAHRSHRSHASHYSSQTGHRSHYSSYSNPATPKRPTVPTTPKPPIAAPKPRVEKKEPTTNSLQPIQKGALATKTKQNDVLSKNQAKTGTVKFIPSPSVIILEDATIVQLIGVKEKQFSDIQKKTLAYARASASLTKWVKGKSVRVVFLEGNKGYVFVFPNELESRCVNLELLREGVLVADEDTSIYAHHVLLKAQQDAQKKRLWCLGQDHR